MNLFAIFLTGLTSGGVSCASVQGGLLASVIANQEKGEFINQKIEKKKNKKNAKQLTLSENTVLGIQKKDVLPVASFLFAKLLSHTLLGFALGLLGESISFSLGFKIGMQIFAALFMLATAANFLELHPIFRYLSFQSPRFFRKLVKNTSKSNLLFAPALLGLLSIFIPCGVTQSMEVLAISSGNPWQAASIMFTFVLGTFPIFAALGILTAKLSEKWQHVFNKSAAAILTILAVYSLNGALVALDSPFSLTRLATTGSQIFQKKAAADTLLQSNESIQRVTIDIQNSGYSPRYIRVKKGIPVELTLRSGDVYSCAQSFVLRAFNISTIVSAHQSKTYTFTPEKVGKYTYSCSMGMYTGTLEVI